MSDELQLRALFETTRVGELTLTQVPQLEPDDTVADACAQMRSVSHGSALVCENDRIVGILTERDLLPVIDDGEVFCGPVRNVMTPDPQTLREDDPLIDAVRNMDEGGYRRLPVVNDAGCAAGIVDVKTIVHFLVEQIPSTVYNQAESRLSSVSQKEGA